MVTKIELKNFKRFKSEIFDLQGNIVLAGPNNSGKTTLIQAIVTWNLAARKWHQERGPETGSKAKKRTGVQLTRSEFTAIPLREMNLLWNERSTGLRSEELGAGQKVGFPKHMEITVHGKEANLEWSLGMQFTYRFPDLILVRPTDDTDTEKISHILETNSMLIIPSFSGIGISETRYDKPYQEMLLGQGKPGDLIRNKLLEVYERNGKDTWYELVSVVQEIFGYTLLPPQYGGQPYIVSEYIPYITPLKQERPKNADTVLDISSAGSGFLQVVLLLGFIYSQSATLILLDEPDAHLHVMLQKQVYDLIRKVVSKNRSQLIVATHSEVVIDNTSPSAILSFYQAPHRLRENYEAEQVQAALKSLSSMDILLADKRPYILYLEGKSDFNLLREWSKVLNHPFHSLFYSMGNEIFWHNNVGRDPKNAKAHLFALKAINPQIKGVLLLDGDSRGLSDHEIRQDGLELIRWRRYEAENYLLHPTSIKRFISNGEAANPFTDPLLEIADTFLKNNLLPANLSEPFTDNDLQENIPASKKILPGLFEACNLDVRKSEYYLIAAQMKPEEIHPEVINKLDFLVERFSRS